MKRYMVFLSLGVLSTAHSLCGQVIISEVMFNPRGNEQANEFVELFNRSTTDAVALTGWRIGEPAALDEILAYTEGLVLRPQQFAVILDPNYFQSSTQYDALIPADALIITINDNTLGSGGFSNSTPETVVLLNAAGDTVAQYSYSLGNADGISDEKITLNEEDAPRNWANALRVDGTPGFANSVATARRDGALLPLSLAITPLPLREHTAAHITVLLQNVGLETFSAASIDFDLIPRGRELGGPIYLGQSTAQQPLAHNDTLRFSLTVPAINAGRYNLLATLDIANDTNRRNDTLSLPLAVGWARETVVINEIMFEPAGGQPEWIEIYNPQDFSLPLPEWAIEDESGARGTIAQMIFIPPKSYRVLAATKEIMSAFNLADTAVILLNKLPSLNNTGDSVILRDFTGAVIDSVAYDRAWGAAGKALEKVWYERKNTERNWRPSHALRGATPGALNSVSPREYDMEMRPLRFEPERPALGEVVELGAVLRNSGRKAYESFRVAISYDSTTTSAPVILADTVIVQTLLPEDSVVVLSKWRAQPSGKMKFVAEVFAEADREAANNRAVAQLEVGFAAQAVVINEIMFDPREGEPEWIELFNPNSGAVSLCQWSLEDAAHSRAVIANAVVVPPRSYRVVTASAELAAQYSLPDSVVWVLPSFPALNQTEETIYLRDLNGNLIDAVAYRSEWGARGRSLEKSWHEHGNTRANWLACVAVRGATPAAFNSVSPRDYDLAAQVLRFTPPRPHFGESVRLFANIVNRGRHAVEKFSVVFYAAAEPSGQSVALGEVIDAHGLPSQDSVLVAMDWPQPPSGKTSVWAEVTEPRDFVADNNRAAATLPLGYPARSVVINEIYYDARSNEIEWFELYNRSASAVNLSTWFWLDNDASAPVFFPDSAFMLRPGSYAVVSSRGDIPLLESDALRVQLPKWLSLNNDNDCIRVYDFNGGAQDSVRFSSNWGGASGVSLERINPNLASQDSSNWSTCVVSMGATPGRQNSIFTAVLPNNASLAVSPSPFSPNDDGVDDFAIFQFHLPVPIATVHLKIYDLRGRLIRHLLKNSLTGAQAEVVWNGRDEQGQTAATGLYIAYLLALYAERGVSLSAKTTVVLVQTFN